MCIIYNPYGRITFDEHKPYHVLSVIGLLSRVKRYLLVIMNRFRICVCVLCGDGLTNKGDKGSEATGVNENRLLPRLSPARPD